ncbi:dTMP kinase [Chelatococcus sambhunathii]|uniref:Thymidylate kinase n=1 Tax=Chelatococcus sambhunathii TaxID=363953 RepID=A0ABU1DG35_9HYPH|nr:dTMP kinase [Chelatococcus sambhunathii]MDR4306964.1 dTMP kinase [Chelatococcus sambhunathii]
MAGRFVTFEGGEGVGKSTQIRRLAERLRDLAHDVVLTREPGGSPRAERLRETLLSGGAKRFGTFAETTLIASARADHVDRVIRPALQRGAIVLCDRYVDSTRAYQGSLGGLDKASIRSLERVATAGAWPDLTVILDAPVERSLERVANRAQGAAGDRFESEGRDFHGRLRAAFVEIAREEPERCVLVDAEGPEPVVAGRVWDVVSRRLGLTETKSRAV